MAVKIDVLGHRPRLRAFVAAAALVLSALLTPPAGAATVIVDCSGATPGAFTSIGAAISSLTGPPPTNDWHYVLLKSDCRENVVVSGGRRVWIAPQGSECPYSGCTYAGPPLRITAARAGDVVQVLGPSDVTLVHLLVSGGANGVSAAGNANVATFDVTAEDNTGSGFNAGGGSSMTISEGGARRNGWVGVEAGDGAIVSLGGQLPFLHNQPVVVTENRGGGVRTDRGSLLGSSGTRVEGNLGPGITAYGGTVLWGAYVGEALIQNNKGGILLSERSTASLWTSQTGTHTIRDNGPFGVYLEKNSHASVYSVLIEGHAGAGVDAILASDVSLHGTRVRGNGAELPGVGGVRVDGNSQAFIEQAQITDNVGPGVVVDLNSSVEARQATVTGNARAGFRVLDGSTLALIGGSLSSNGGPPVTCDATSHVLSNTLPRTYACFNLSRVVQPRPARQP